MASGW